MTSIHATTVIAAPIEVCFQLSLDLDLEMQSASGSHLRAIAGVTSGPIRSGQSVTWQVRQFGFRFTHTSLISGYDEPHYFRDSMTKGLFRSFAHDHFFRQLGPRSTEMRDRMHFSMPALLLGPVTERLLVKRRLGSLLANRNALIRERAEATP